jgi:hypothetical protein
LRKEGVLKLLQDGQEEIIAEIQIKQSKDYLGKT